MKYLALLRGINVGGKNVIKKDDLIACFERLGFTDVVSYIQSGNLVFEAPRTSVDFLAKRISASVGKSLATPPTTLVLPKRALRAIVDAAPKGFGGKPGVYRYDVFFLLSGVDAKAVLKTIAAKEGVDAVDAGPGAIYHRRLIAKAASSAISKIASSPFYKDITIRNWRTTTSLLELMGQ